MTVKDAAADIGDVGDVKICLNREWFLMNLPPDATFELVLKRGKARCLGGLTSRLSLLFDILPRIISRA
jgi:hypothetical protein